MTKSAALPFASSEVGKRQEGRVSTTLDTNGLSAIRADFPGLVTASGTAWHYLDTAATAQKPRQVIDATVRAMGRDYATVHRGVYARSADMTIAFEAARARVARFVNAASASEIVFVRGATEGINWSPTAGARRISSRATASCCRRWSITATSSPGSSSPSGPGRPST